MHATSPRPRFLFCIVALSACLSSASGSAFADTDLFFSELPTVASISRLLQRQADAPASVTVIDRAMIRASGARSLSDLFRLVPGFQTFAASDKQTRVNYHGITDDDFSPRVQVLVDGRSLHSPLFIGGVNWALMPVALDDIEYIEVVRGSNTVSYGTNAFLGVINIITTDPALSRGGSVSISRGNQGVLDYALRGGVQLGTSANLRISYRQIRDDGLDEIPDGDGIFSWADRNRSRMLDVRYVNQIDAGHLLEVGFGHVEAKSLTGRLIDNRGTRSPGDPLRNQNEASTWLQLHWTRVGDDGSDTQLRYAFSQDTSDSTYRIDRGLAEQLLTQRFAGDPVRLTEELARLDKLYLRTNAFGGRSDRHEIELTRTLAVNDVRYSYGASWRNDALRSQTMLRDLGTVDRNTTRAFANAEWRPRDWFTGNAGASYEYDSLAGGHLSPRISGAFHFAPGQTVRLGYTRAWRTANILDYRARYLVFTDEAEWVGNRALPAERLDSWEIGYLGEWQKTRLVVDVRAFSERVKNRLQTRIRTGESFGFVNRPNTTEPVQHLHIQGYELHLTWRPLSGTRLQAGHASIRIDSENSRRGIELLNTTPSSNFLTAQDRYVELARLSAPRRSTSLMWTQDLPWGGDFSLMWFRVGDIKWTRNTFAPGYERFDLRVAYPLRIGSQLGEIAYTAQSLKGAHFEEREQRIVDRRHWVTLRLDF